MRTRRVREVQQLTRTECGLCCVAMVLSAYGSRGTVARLRRDHETGRDGLSLREVASILRGYGMRVRSFRAGTDKLGELRLPLVAHWNDNHLVVVEEVTDSTVTVVDPASGRRRYPIREFESHYSGIVIEAGPTDAYRPVVHRDPSVWWEFLRSLRGAGPTLARVFGLSLLLHAFMLCVPLGVQAAINGHEAYFAHAPVGPLLAMLLLPLVLYYLVSFLRSVFLASVVRSLGEEMMGKAFGRLLTLPYRYFAGRSQGELMYRLASIASVRDMLSGQAMTVVLDVGGLVVVFGYIFHRSPLLGAVALAVFLCMVAIAVVSYRPIRTVVDREISAGAESTGIQMEAMNSIETLKVSGMTGPFLDTWRTVYAGAMKQTWKRIIVQGAASSGYSAFQVFGPLAVLVTGLWLVHEGRLDLGSAVAVQTLTATLLGTVTSLSGAFTQLITANAQVERVGDILNQPAGEEMPGDAKPPLTGEISLRGVGFAYPGSRVPVLEDVSFDVPAGSRVAVVGSTGSGKSTLSKLLMGLYPLGAGEIRYDGVPLTGIDADWFYRHVAYVPQEISLSNRSIADNIRFGLPDADPETVRRAAREAQIDRDIEVMPLGYHTQVREMGGSLSGGQRQRIAIARALARAPRVLVLDEATSSLDTVTEAMIAATLDGLRCTRVIIAHRLSTVMNADLIVVLQEGRVVQTGRHDELVGRQGPYQALVRSQIDVTA
ncbi:ABC-type bacteriocin/lantibiotic exporter, contains an N-terminal double-glycine peptidase domain [Nocardiopsis flavescens]|uniref:ABC-type bacteriocin/lantibiotic exporter, contains an N-terminal double-glycine peptidase domain n=1 Tax=Nocardiopsis flavescens TaxID=758803 RepID=A0A1M6JJV5_9ACTN|nr:peptidase domain-containing ABC transporter [Nocardiopsis flavescens]SHJ46970.1 ABC-type bacteriocin/lantibiotic exporter, contains an N-terminal double-glycine peptidase domain [Nocardiopsis flavescens]